MEGAGRDAVPPNPSPQMIPSEGSRFFEQHIDIQVVFYMSFV